MRILSFYFTTLVNPSLVSAKIDDCVLGKNTKIGVKAELNRCITQAGYEVNAGGWVPLDSCKGL